MEVLILLLILQIKHWYADFQIQTYMQTVKKGIWLDLVGISHSIDHVILTLVGLFVFGLYYPIDPIDIILVAAVEGILHYLIDYVKVKFGSKDLFNPPFWRQFGLDQLAHQLCYILMIWYLLLR